MTRPLIGISAYREQARWGVWDEPAVLIPANYADQVAAAGGIPVLLAPMPGIEAAIKRLDGLILAGGPDVEPGRYGEQPGPHITVVRPDRDAAELALCAAALDADLPVLAVCRGMQLVNVALGGTLIQHLPDSVGHDRHCPVPGQMASHEVKVDPASRLGAILGTGPHAVPTHHHQGIGKLAAGLTATAWADDGMIEAFEQTASDNLLAVQWHPEASDDPALFQALLTAAGTG